MAIANLVPQGHRFAYALPYSISMQSLNMLLLASCACGFPHWETPPPHFESSTRSGQTAIVSRFSIPSFVLLKD